MSNARHPFGRPAVLQGNFQGRLPAFAIQARVAFPPAAARGQAAQPQRIGNAFQVPPAIDMARLGQGRPLPDAVLQKMESFFNTDFSDVRVHVGPQAQALGALAFTMGSSIHFAPGQYNPDSPHGHRLLGHELAHVVQQRSGRVRNPFGSGVAVVVDQGMEAEAERMGLRAAAHHVPAPARSVQARPAQGQGGKAPAPPPAPATRRPAPPASPVIMRKVGFEYEIGSIKTQKNTSYLLADGSWVAHGKGEVLKRNTGYDITADIDAHGGSQIEFILKEIDENSAPERLAIVAAAQNVVADIQALTAAPNVGNWVQAHRIARINGSRWQRFQSQGGYYQTVGQLQMTGGIRIRKLAAVTTGNALGEPDPRNPARTFHAFAQQYSTHNQQGERRQALFWAAVAAVQHFFHWHIREQYLLASVITMMATIPLNARNSMPDEQGLLQARTDYSKILMQLAEDLGKDIPYQRFLDALLRTINSQHNGARVLSTDGIFPAGHRIQGQDLTGLTIGTWVRSMLPTAGRFWGRWQGKDLLTKQHFPGTQAQKDQLRSYGGFGSKTDPGDKLILEWRNLNMSHPDDLVMIVQGLVDYIRRANG